jgi:hypothetical protein
LMCTLQLPEFIFIPKAQYDSKSNTTRYNCQKLNRKQPNLNDNLDPKHSLFVESDTFFSFIAIMVTSY